MIWLFSLFFQEIQFDSPEFKFKFRFFLFSLGKTHFCLFCAMKMSSSPFWRAAQSLQIISFFLIFFLFILLKANGENGERGVRGWRRGGVACNLRGVSHIFPKSFMEMFGSNFINFLDFCKFPCYKETNDSAYNKLCPHFSTIFSNCYKVILVLD